ncbi:MAG: hypothetical protein HQ582_22385, partial [Planctomycetes bacterium]|nr:hypothetical protein [Planctomycetota bacterium]
MEYLRGGQQFEPEDGQQFEPTIGGDATDPEKPQEKVSRPDDTAENLTAAWDGYRGALADKDGPKAKVYSEEIKHLGGDLDKPPGEERAKPIETQRKPREPKVKAPKRMEGKAAQRKAGEMLKRQQAEAEARLSPEDRTAREAKRGQETEQRNKEAKQEEQRNQAREAEVRRDRAKEAARAFDFAISQHLSDPDDQAMLKDVATNVWKQKRQENSQWNTAREEILGHILPNDPTARAAFTRAVQRAGDSDQIPRFDEAVQIAERDYGWFLEYDTGESAGKGDAEGALFKALKQGKRKDPPRHDPKILKEAMGWIEHHAGWPSDEGEEREPTEESRRKEAELRELEAVPFSLRRWLELVRYAKWTGPNTGPRGGVYWISSETGLKHYGERPPEEGETSQPQQQPAEENVELQAAREKIKDSHSLDDIAAGKYPIGAEGSGGEDAEEARAQGMFVVRLRGHDFFALSEEAAQPMIDYMKGGGRYGTTTMSRLMGYTPEQIADYANFLRLSGRDDLIDKDPTPQTASPEFRKWFGDSKVVDDDGEPLRVFHGTHDPGFDEFKLTGASDGFFFAPNPDDAIHRATTQKGVLPVYLSLQNPRMMDSHESAGVSGEVEPENEAIMDAKEMGHDGIILFADDPDLRTYVAFDASQIKSATGNRGTFDPDDPRIT